MIYAQLHLTLPAWIHEEVDAQRAYPSAQDKVALAIQLSRRNVDHRSGGPFGAAVFSGDRLVGVGVNRVVPHNCSAAHAEVMALTTSQQRMQSFRLNQAGGRITLATSAQPCSMCYGALIWAGIDELLIAAAQLANWRVLSRPAGTSWVIDLNAARTAGYPRPSVAKKLRAAWRKLEEHGTLRWRYVRGADWNTAALEDMGRIEAQSWIARTMLW